jgi:hypothetical protein
MRHRQYTLTPRHVHGRATHLIQKHVRLRDHGPKAQYRLSKPEGSGKCPPNWGALQVAENNLEGS